uniref:3-oxo-5-alpha-steroid 4-dehydrogenase C-terminal domain-containing protein n=1 Tax=Neogobius melanostomus TaxID=47308 RepID=A0A8C6WP86_9GOBI
HCHKTPLAPPPAPYGRYTEGSPLSVPACWGWFLQELPAFLVPALMACTTDGSVHGRRLLLCTFMLHYLHRSLVYPFFLRGRPHARAAGGVRGRVCLLNGFLQTTPSSLLPRTGLGLALFRSGPVCVWDVMNIHSDHILRSLRRPGETVYRIPRGGLFELVSGANFLAEIVEWFGFAVAVWTLPAFSFAFFTAWMGPEPRYHNGPGAHVCRSTRTDKLQP